MRGAKLLLGWWGCVMRGADWLAGFNGEVRTFMTVVACTVRCSESLSPLIRDELLKIR